MGSSVAGGAWRWNLVQSTLAVPGMAERDTIGRKTSPHLMPPTTGYTWVRVTRRCDPDKVPLREGGGKQG